MATTSQLLMIRPAWFGYNAETAVNNAFQVNSAGEDTHQQALAEFDAFVALLRANEVSVLVVDDTPEPHTPDSIFPNNWISFHEAGRVVLYPMFAKNRRAERKPSVIAAVTEKFGSVETIDLSVFEATDQYLEGTGSMVLDRDNKIAYACISPRTDPAVLDAFCERMGYTPVLFHAADARGTAIYHTNVLMCVADQYVVICTDAISSAQERERVRKTIADSGKSIVEISPTQLDHFAGNMLQVRNQQGELLLVMSKQARESLEPSQVNQLEGYNRILSSSLNTIETNGGGSARCMMAEVFLGMLFMLLSITGMSQAGYRDSLESFQKKYVDTHEVVKGEARRQLHFYPINPLYRVQAVFTAQKKQSVVQPGDLIREKKDIPGLWNSEFQHS